MSNKLAKRASEELVSLAVEIREEHEACEHDAQSAVERAIRCGEMLSEAKEKAGHGNWLPWLEANFPSSERTARGYMAMAANRQRVADIGSVREALAELAEPRTHIDTEDERNRLTAEPVPAVSPDGPDTGFEEILDAEVVDDDGTPDVQGAPEFVPRVRCPTCGHMVASDDIQTWKE